MQLEKPSKMITPTPPSSALVPKRPLIMRLGKRIQPWVNGIVAKSSKIGNYPFYEPRDFPWITQLEAHWEEIKKEADTALQDLNTVPPLATISPDHRRIAPAGKWRAFFLYGYGYRVDGNCQICPRTAELVKDIPGLNSAFFSILAPHTHLPTHTGVTKAIITCHLGLTVPNETEKCQMRVVDQHVGWQEGKALVFDDVFQHEVRNDTDEIRVVLLIQFRRPVGILGKLIGGLFLWGVKHSRFVQEGRRGLKEWAA
ncbi:aspartyl/asparaginyl beta-hydroxylase domain-containing protein [Aquirhabdus parva]|nr:aspartyl/asparaginyl beta-hydroxylase domain-containing protein [Aquirhabdus parva]